MPNKSRILLLVSVLLITVLVAWVIWGNTALEVTEYTITNTKIPEEFSGYRIVQVSDLHNAQMGRNNRKLLVTLEHAEPDIIVITGDLIDSRKTDLNIALQFAKDAAKIAQCYYITGNHEARVAEYSTLKDALKEIGFTVLDDTAHPLMYQGSSITLIGINDPSFQTDYLLGNEEAVIKGTLDSIDFDEDTFQLLLSHRPEFLPVYAEYGLDLVLSGHVHGGQFRIPSVGGLYGPNQGLFPEYDAGLYKDENTTMIVSRGIGNSLFPFRINNRPEVIVITLDNE